MNLSIGSTFFVDAAAKVTGRQIKTVVRRIGDQSRLIAGSSKARKTLAWNPKFADIEMRIGSAWAWHQANENGYDD